MTRKVAKEHFFFDYEISDSLNRIRALFQGKSRASKDQAAVCFFSFLFSFFCLALFFFYYLFV